MAIILNLKMYHIYVAFFSIFLGVIAQLIMKKGMNEIGTVELSQIFEINLLLKIFTNRYIVLGVMFYVFGLLFWLIALSSMDVSKTYPLQSLGYVIVLFGSFFFLGESLSLSRGFGIFLIILGSLFVIKS